MKYSKATKIKLGIFLFALLIAASTVYYSNSIVSQLRKDNREVVSIYASVIAKTINEETDANLGFVFDEIIKKVKFPIIYSDSQNTPLYSKNLANPQSLDGLKEILNSMDRINDPIPIKYFDAQANQAFVLGFLHYGDSILIQKLQWLPFIEIAIVSIFILVGFLGFNSITDNEKRQLLVSMSRETAHQLSTPISALLGWVERIKSHPDQATFAAKEMSSDITRLEQIADRFSQMGTESNLQKIELSDLINSQVKYLKKRLPALSDNILLKVNIVDSPNVMGNKVLLGWALENIIRNAIDSIKSSDGKIELCVEKKEDIVFITISDNGSGIAKKDWKNIFKPGFSSKKGGWGLGLSLVRRIVEEIHNGKVQILSSSPGIGTTFEIKLKSER